MQSAKRMALLRDISSCSENWGLERSASKRRIHMEFPLILHVYICRETERERERDIYIYTFTCIHILLDMQLL